MDLSEDLVNTLIQGFFENIVEEDPYETDLLKFISRILKIEISAMTDPSQIFKSKEVIAWIIRHGIDQCIHLVLFVTLCRSCIVETFIQSGNQLWQRELTFAVTSCILDDRICLRLHGSESLLLSLSCASPGS